MSTDYREDMDVLIEQNRRMERQLDHTNELSKKCAAENAQLRERVVELEHDRQDAGLLLRRCLGSGLVTLPFKMKDQISDWIQRKGLTGNLLRDEKIADLEKQLAEANKKIKEWDRLRHEAFDALAVGHPKQTSLREELIRLEQQLPAKDAEIARLQLDIYIVSNTIKTRINESYGKRTKTL